MGEWKVKWKRFKKWCRRNHKIIGCVLLGILILIGVIDWYVNGNEIVNNKIQIGGWKLSSKSGALGGYSSTKAFAAKPDMDIATEGRATDKAVAVMREGRKKTSEVVGGIADRGMDKMRSGAAFIYEILYQIAFVIIILLIIFPSISLFIICIVCFILLRQKLAYFKSL